MTNHSVNYQLSDAKRQERLREFTYASDPEDLRAELGAARLLAQEAMDAGQTALASRLLETISKCAQGQIATQRVKGELLERVVVLRIATAMCNLLGTALDHHNLPETERGSILEEVSAGLDAVFEEIEPKRITDERDRQ
jgi:hypothetical protein